jgi:hypothetical protein
MDPGRVAAHFAADGSLAINGANRLWEGTPSLRQPRGSKAEYARQLEEGV